MVGEKLIQTNLLSRLSHKVCRLLSSPVLLGKFTNIKLSAPCLIDLFTGKAAILN